VSGLFRAALAGGVIGTIVMTTMLRAASEFGFTRMDLPFLLGTAFTDNRRRAKVYGYAAHFVLGMLFAFGYAFVFLSVRRTGPAVGFTIGIVHASFVATTLVNVLLPIVHPRMGTPETAADQVALLEPPGFMMLNYGRSTFAVTLVGHMAYGAIIGWACANMS
jgi:hypothetical protein